MTENETAAATAEPVAHEHEHSHEDEERAHNLSMRCWRGGQKAKTTEDWERAVDDGRAAAELAPEAPEVRFNLAVALTGLAAAKGDAAIRLEAAQSFDRGRELVADGAWARYVAEALGLLEKREPQLGREPAYVYAVGTHLGALGKAVRGRRALAALSDEPTLSEMANAALAQIPEPVQAKAPAVGRNDPCPCGSGKKYKKCHGAAA